MNDNGATPRVSERVSRAPALAMGELTQAPRKNVNANQSTNDDVQVSPRVTYPRVSPRATSPSYAAALGRALSTYRQRETSEELESASVPPSVPPASKFDAPTKTTYSTSAVTAAKPAAEEVVVADSVAAAHVVQPQTVSPMKARRSCEEGPVTPRTRSPTIGEALAKALSEVSGNGHLVEVRPTVQRGPQLTPIKPSAPGARASSPSRVIKSNLNNGGGTPRATVTPRTRSPTLSESLGAAMSTFKQPKATLVAAPAAAPPPVLQKPVVEKTVDHEENSLSSPRSHLIIRAQPIYPTHPTRGQTQPQPNAQQENAAPMAKRSTPAPHELIPKFERYVRPKVLKTEQPATAPAAAASHPATATAQVGDKPKPRPRRAVVAHYPNKNLIPPPATVIALQANAAAHEAPPQCPQQTAPPPPPPAKRVPLAAAVHKDVNAWETKQEREPPLRAESAAVEVEPDRKPTTTAPPPPVVPAASTETPAPKQPSEKNSPSPQAEPAVEAPDKVREAASEERPNARSPRTRYAVQTVKPSFASALGRVIMKVDPSHEGPPELVVPTPAETQSPSTPPPSVASMYQSLVWNKDKGEHLIEQVASRRTPTPPPPAATPKETEDPLHPNRAAADGHPTPGYLSVKSSGRSTPLPPPPPTTPAVAAPKHELPVPLPVEPVVVQVHRATHETPTTMSAKQPMVLSKGAYVIRRADHNKNNTEPSTKPTAAPPAPTKPLAKSPPKTATDAASPPAATPKVTLPAAAAAPPDLDDLPYEKRYMKFLRADWSIRSKNTPSTSATSLQAKQPQPAAPAAEKVSTGPTPHIQVTGIRKADGTIAAAPQAAPPVDSAPSPAQATGAAPFSHKSGTVDWRERKCGAPRGNRDDPSRRFRGHKQRDHEDVGAWHGCQPGAWDGRPRYRGSQGHKARSPSAGGAAE